MIKNKCPVCKSTIKPTFKISKDLIQRRFRCKNCGFENKGNKSLGGYAR